MIGAIAGDIIGSIYEFDAIKTTSFPLFGEGCGYTDDSVMTVAVADCILHNKDYTNTLQEYGRRYPNRGYGGFFARWLITKDPKPYGSYGNGSAMRVSPIGFAYNTLSEVENEAQRSAEITHNDPEGIKGAQAVAVAILLARQGKSKSEIKEFLLKRYGYNDPEAYRFNLNLTLNQIRPYYNFDETCQGTVPLAIAAFLESSDYESAVRNAISLGGDADTLACITGGIAQAFYKTIPPYIINKVHDILDPGLLQVVKEYNKKYGF